LGTYLVFSVVCVHILTRDETNALCRLDEKTYHFRDRNLQNREYGSARNLELTTNATKGVEGDGS
jgi:hypothetical protein